MTCAGYDPECSFCQAETSTDDDRWLRVVDAHGMVAQVERGEIDVSPNGDLVISVGSIRTVAIAAGKWERAFRAPKQGP